VIGPILGASPSCTIPATAVELWIVALLADRNKVNQGAVAGRSVSVAHLGGGQEKTDPRVRNPVPSERRAVRPPVGTSKIAGDAGA